MRSVLPERRHVNGHALLEGAIAETHRAMLANSGRRSVSGSVPRPNTCWAGRRMCAGATCPTASNRPRACPKCRSVQSQRFSRNGSRRRQLLTRWGEVPLRWPRFVCECGGSITLDLDDWLRPYQRIGSDVDAQIQRWGALSVSLREMQGELAHSYMGVLGPAHPAETPASTAEPDPGRRRAAHPAGPATGRHLVHPTVRHRPVAHRRQRPPPPGQKPPQTLPLDRLGRLARPDAKRSWPGTWPTARTPRAG